MLKIILASLFLHAYAHADVIDLFHKSNDYFQDRFLIVSYDCKPAEFDFAAGGSKTDYVLNAFEFYPLYFIPWHIELHVANGKMSKSMSFFIDGYFSNIQ